MDRERKEINDSNSSVMASALENFWADATINAGKTALENLMKDVNMRVSDATNNAIWGK